MVDSSIVSNGKTHCIPPILLPSLTSTNANVFCFRTVRTHPLIDTISLESVAAAVLTRRGDGDDEFIDVNDDDDEGTTATSVGLLASVLNICNDVPEASMVDFVQLLRITLLAPLLLPTASDSCDDRLLLLIIIDGGANAATMGRLDDDDDDATTVAAARRQVRNAIFFTDQKEAAAGVVVIVRNSFPLYPPTPQSYGLSAIHPRSIMLRSHQPRPKMW